MSTVAARRDAEGRDPGAIRAAGEAAARRVDPGFAVRILAPSELAGHAGAMRSLVERALARNIFYEAPFLFHAAEHLTDAGRPEFLSIWRAGAGELVALFPVATPRLRFGPRFARGWLSRYMTDGTPLIDNACADAALRTFLDWQDDEGFAGVLFPSVDVDGPFATRLRSLTASRESRMASFDLFERAVLRPGEGESATPIPRAKKRRELLRQRRRLDEEGRITIRAAFDGPSARDAFEEFLALEAEGWKGRAGTAILQDGETAAFARGAISALADEGRCRVEIMEIDGAPLAATIELHAGDRAWFWKTAYDERRARYSPGVQMSLRLTRHHQLSRRFKLIDSCAEADHPMINRLWPDRMRVADIAIGVAAKRNAGFEIAVRREIAARRIRSFAKTLYRLVRPVRG